jgi:hypothetical protein
MSSHRQSPQAGHDRFAASALSHNVHPSASGSPGQPPFQVRAPSSMRLKQYSIPFDCDGSQPPTTTGLRRHCFVSSGNCAVRCTQPARSNTAAAFASNGVSSCGGAQLLSSARGSAATASRSLACSTGAGSDGAGSSRPPDKSAPAVFPRSAGSHPITTISATAQNRIGQPPSTAPPEATPGTTAFRMRRDGRRVRASSWRAAAHGLAASAAPRSAVERHRRWSRARGELGADDG